MKSQRMGLLPLIVLPAVIAAALAVPSTFFLLPEDDTDQIGDIFNKMLNKDSDRTINVIPSPTINIYTPEILVVNEPSKPGCGSLFDDLSSEDEVSSEKSEDEKVGKIGNGPSPPGTAKPRTETKPNIEKKVTDSISHGKQNDDKKKPISMKFFDDFMDYDDLDHAIPETDKVKKDKPKTDSIFNFNVDKEHAKSGNNGKEAGDRRKPTMKDIDDILNSFFPKKLRKNIDILDKSKTKSDTNPEPTNTLTSGKQRDISKTDIMRLANNFLNSNIRNRGIQETDITKNEKPKTDLITIPLGDKEHADTPTSYNQIPNNWANAIRNFINSKIQFPQENDKEGSGTTSKQQILLNILNNLQHGIKLPLNLMRQVKDYIQSNSKNPVAPKNDISNMVQPKTGDKSKGKEAFTFDFGNMGVNKGKIDDILWHLDPRSYQTQYNTKPHDKKQLYDFDDAKKGTLEDTVPIYLYA